MALLVFAGCVTNPQRDLSPREVGLLQQVSEGNRDANEAIVASMTESELRDFIQDLLEAPVEFYGEVEDRDGNPIQDVRIKALLFDKMLDELEPPYVTGTSLPNIRTGKNGVFRITGKSGLGLMLRVEKDGFKPVNDTVRVYYYPQNLASRNKHPLPSAESPATFILEDTELALVRSYYSGSIPLPDEGRSSETSLRQPTPYGVESGTGDLRVTYKQGRVLEDGRYDWSCRVSVPGGGIQRYTDITVDLAPEDGYEESVEVGMQTTDPAWSHRKDFFLVLRMHDGNYAFVRFKVRTRGDHYYIAEGTFNTAGERFLK